jgi:hypothetical protein
MAATDYVADNQTIFLFVPQFVQESVTYQSYSVN